MTPRKLKISTDRLKQRSPSLKAYSCNINEMSISYSTLGQRYCPELGKVVIRGWIDPDLHLGAMKMKNQHSVKKSFKYLHGGIRYKYPKITDYKGRAASGCGQICKEKWKFSFPNIRGRPRLQKFMGGIRTETSINAPLNCAFTHRWVHWDYNVMLRLSAKTLVIGNFRFATYTQIDKAFYPTYIHA